MGEVYDLANTVKVKFPDSRLVLSGGLRNKGVTWRRVGAADDALEWLAGSLGATFIDTNSWVRDLDFGRDGLHVNRNGGREHGDLCSRVCGTEGEIRKVLIN